LLLNPCVILGAKEPSMFQVHYVTHGGRVVSRVNSQADRIESAQAGARQILKRLRAAPGEPVHLLPEGFEIFDPADGRLLHREFL